MKGEIDGKEEDHKVPGWAVIVTMALSAILVLSGCAATGTTTEAETRSGDIIPGSTAVTVHQSRT